MLCYGHNPFVHDHDVHGFFAVRVAMYVHACVSAVTVHGVSRVSLNIISWLKVEIEQDGVPLTRSTNVDHGVLQVQALTHRILVLLVGIRSTASVMPAVLMSCCCDAVMRPSASRPMGRHIAPTAC